MIYLVDTNVLLRVLYRTDPRYPIVRAAVRTLRMNGHQLQATLQNFIEFWNASTRPIDRNGFGLTPSETDRLLQRAERLFPLLPDLPTLYAEWRRLVVTYGVSGVQVHDARLVAAILSHGATHILTFNTADFARYAPEGIVAVDPETVQMTHRADALSRGSLLWSGEHWILYLRPPGRQVDSGQLSLYSAAYSPAGRGTVAYIDILRSEGLTAVCTDNPDLADFITATMIRGSNNPFDRDLPQWPATFSRTGHIDRNPSWTIQSESHTLTATWEQLESPLVGPPTVNPHIVFTVLVFAAAGQMELDGMAVPGSPYPRDAWSKSLGQARSSCCFALAETMVAGHSSGDI